MSTDEMMKIMDEIRENRKKFRVDHFDIVVSEYVSRYKERKIVLDIITLKLIQINRLEMACY
ncbi:MULTISPECIES: hypothetical protein [Enterococcus]|uniref:hypothetical protein n=1 Tax=Enterococcus TaxID=1350 RepID=UPI001389AB11|nr:MULTISPECIES: hypothetical protein [Enterococcus]EGO5957026.1 hypothetical protein [Enterococcus faecalis]EGO9381969.1 hypothetical protein [Enterococcus faecalis]MDK6211677.1 hypothetical protein [Enterococcus faecalis]MDO0904873.1 hypothetical protein [Enterococcus sp. A1(2023)]MDO0922854.1 hypothetical protein [Enterococcus sp. A2(2023)]